MFRHDQPGMSMSNIYERYRKTLGIKSFDLLTQSLFQELSGFGKSSRLNTDHPIQQETVYFHA